MMFVVPFLVPIALLFAKRVSGYEKSQEMVHIQRYSLPKIFKFLETPDELLPCGIYEETMISIYTKWGWFITAWVWIGFRNQAQGIMWGQGKEVPNSLGMLTEEEKLEYSIYRNTYKFGFLKFISGYKVVRDWQSTRTNRGY